MKKILVLSALSLVSLSALADTGHQNYVGSVADLSDNVVITDAKAVADIAKYADVKTQLKLAAAFKDGQLTADEIKASGISDHHFYTGYLASAKNQAEYDKNLKALNGGQNVDDNFVSNRDLKAHGSMVMNQVSSVVKTQASVQAKVDAKQDGRLDKIVEGLYQIGNHIQAQVPTLPDEGGSIPPVVNDYDDTAIKGDIVDLGNRVDLVNDHLSQAGTAIKGNSDRINDLRDVFQAQAAHTASEITRLDGRIDSLEKKTDKLKAGVAGANAIGSLTQYTGSGTHHVAVGLGGYEGASALAGGYTYAVSYNTTIRVTVAYDSEGDFGYGASVGHSW